MKIKEKVLKLEKEIRFFGGKDFDKRKDVDLTDEGDLTATLKSAKLSGFKECLAEVGKVIDEELRGCKIMLKENPLNDYWLGREIVLEKVKQKLGIEVLK